MFLIITLRIKQKTTILDIKLDDSKAFVDLRPIYEDIQFSRNIDSLLIIALMISLVSYMTKLNKSLYIYAGMIIKVTS